MDPSRSERIANVMKDITGLGKAIKKPSTLRYIPPQQGRLAEPVAGSQIIRILMIGVASLLLIGVILLCIDQWVTPIFQRAPGDGAYIPIPGIDPSELFWANSANVANITVGIPPPPAPGTAALSTSVIENQGNYGITMDILIQDEYPQNLGNDSSGNPIIHRTFFVLGPDVNNPTLQASIHNQTNTCIITAIDSTKQLQSIEIDNVPIHSPFRIGISMSPHIMEGYLNGLLVKTRQLKTTTVLPGTGAKIFAPANITINGNLVSQGIKIRNMRTFGYTVASSEMKGRMNDGLLTGSAWKI
jgi:hypothetical protein